MSEDIKKRADQLVVGDFVDLESDPVLADEIIAEFEFVEILSIDPSDVRLNQPPGVLVVSYNSVGRPGLYPPDQVLTVMGSS